MCYKKNGSLFLITSNFCKVIEASTMNYCINVSSLFSFMSLSGRIAWSAGNSDFGQYFVIDLGETKNVTAIATQGRPYTSEFVQEYRIEYGNNGMDFSEYKDAEGNTKVNHVSVLKIHYEYFFLFFNCRSKCLVAYEQYLQ